GEISAMHEAVKALAADVHSGKISGQGGKFTNLLVIGIGGSALGPQFVAKALGCPTGDEMNVYFFDNTDPAGMAKVLGEIDGELPTTLSLVISKSGGTPETRNGMLEAKAAYEAAGLNFAKHAVAITGVDSKLDKQAVSEGWLARLPMWDWVGGRTSETGPVGLAPAALQGLDIEELIRGAAEMDEATRVEDMLKNPAMLLALCWYYATKGKGEKDMVVLPYKDSLELFSKYLQQLIMESLGKEFDLDGKLVNQGISVYGNKGSTDQHAYVQQLREGVANFFVTFIEVLEDKSFGQNVEVEPGVTSGDYLQGFYLGTRTALAEKGRESLTITVSRVDAYNVGMLIALYERAVGFYATLVNINAYHQPGVEAGKKAAAGILAAKLKIQALMAQNGPALDAEEVSEKLGLNDPEMAFKLLENLAANPSKHVVRETASPLTASRYRGM
ncbi:MAG: glucose-6-phosphate isomerase, partial [Opitutales bacterium]|nr:glucose-6-phosphate isomerase [Opitutales bacterium]